MKEQDKRIVMAVFGTLLEEHTWDELNASPFRLGSMTINGMADLYKRLKYEDYCNRNGIAYEEMTEKDFEEFALEEARSMGYEV